MNENNQFPQDQGAFEDQLGPELNPNLARFSACLGVSPDIIIRKFTLGVQKPTQGALIFIDSLVIKISMAVFKRDKMVGTLNEAEIRGLLWVTGQVQSGAIEVSTPNKQGKVTLKIIPAKSKVILEIRGNQIRMRLEFKSRANM